MSDENKVEIVKEGTWADYSNQVHDEEQVVEQSAEPAVEQPVEPVEQAVEPVQQAIEEQPAVVEPAVVEQPVEQAAQPELSWEEVLKNNGFDEFDIELLKFKKATGDVTPYLEVKTVDYSKMPAEEIMKRDLKRKYSGLSDKALEYKYREEVLGKYKLQDSFDEEEQAIGKELMEYDANLKRQQFIEEQAKFKAPQKDVEAEARRQQEEQQAAVRQWSEGVKSNPVTQNLISSKKLVLDGGGDYKFNLQVDNPDELFKMITDPNEYNKHIFVNGELDLNKAYLSAAITKNPQLFIKSLIDYGKSLGVKEEVEVEHNISKESASPAKQTETLWEAFLNRGTPGKLS